MGALVLPAPQAPSYCHVPEYSQQEVSGGRESGLHIGGHPLSTTPVHLCVLRIPVGAGDWFFSPMQGYTYAVRLCGMHGVPALSPAK